MGHLTITGGRRPRAREISLRAVAAAGLEAFWARVVLLSGQDDGAIERAPAQALAGRFGRLRPRPSTARVHAPTTTALSPPSSRARARPADHPLIVHVLDRADAQAFSSGLGDLTAARSMPSGPGPLTIIVPRAPAWPRPPPRGRTPSAFALPRAPGRALLAAARRLGVPGVAAPSANRFGRISPDARAACGWTSSESGADLLVLDGGDCEVGIESTIVDRIDPRASAAAAGQDCAPAHRGGAGPAGPRDADSPRASGTLEAYFASRTAPDGPC